MRCGACSEPAIARLISERQVKTQYKSTRLPAQFVFCVYDRGSSNEILPPRVHAYQFHVAKIVCPNGLRGWVHVPLRVSARKCASTRARLFGCVCVCVCCVLPGGAAATICRWVIISVCVCVCVCGRVHVWACVCVCGCVRVCM